MSKGSQSEQLRRVLAVLAGPAATARQWLEPVVVILQGDGRIEPDTLEQLAAIARGDYARAQRYFPDDGEAHVWLWATLHRVFPREPRVLALYADNLLQHGGGARRGEALRLWTDAVRADPQQFVESAGEFVDVAQELGKAPWLDYRLAKVRFYADEVNRGEMETAELQDEVCDLLREVADDPAARAMVTDELRRLALTV